jgi:hypothetical protein
VVGCKAACGVLTIGVWVGVAIVVVGWGSVTWAGATPLHPGTTWQYLGFFFDRALTFQEHTKCYTNKALTTVRAMLALGNSVRGL